MSLSADDAEVDATFVPSAGMVGCSLRHRGDELLETRGGLARYASERSTMGIPLLHPWANRIDGFAYEAAGRRVELDPDSRLLRFDPNGLPIHGLVSACRGWEITEKAADERSARLSARLDFAADTALMELFPFPHELVMAVELAGPTLTIRTTLTPTADDPVPVAFGYHPYFTLPGQPAAEWQIETPVRAHVEVDDRLIPTGASEPVTIEPGADRGADLRRWLRLARGARALQRHGRRPDADGGVPRGLPGRGDLAAAGRRVHLLRADDRAHERARLR